MTLTQDLFDRQVEHLLMTKRYQEAARLLIDKETSRHKGTVSSMLRRDPKVNLELQREVARYVEQLHSIGTESIKDYIGAELDFQTNSLRKATGSWYTVQSSDRGLLARKITSTPLKLALETKQHGTIAEGFESLGQAHYTRISASIRRGIADGLTPDQVIANVVRQTGVTQSQATTLVNTNFSQAEALVKNDIAEKNSTVIKGMEFTAILDSRTSKLCSGYDGLIQPVDKIKIRPPLHWNCRSTLVPILKSKAQLLESNSPLLDKSQLVGVPDYQLTGASPLKEDFTEWLRRQSMPTKLKYLDTEEKVTLFEQGQLKVSDFFNTLGRPISLAALRVKDNLLTLVGGGEREVVVSKRLTSVTRPFQLTRSKETQSDLYDLIIADTANPSQAIALTDYRGTTLGGKRSVRTRTMNEFDPRNNTFDPFTGQSKSTLYYDPDFTLYRERLDYMRNSKLLDVNQKDFIETFANSLEGRISVNQQSVVVENLRVVFERYQKQPVPWDDFVSVYKAESNFSVVNVSRLLDRRSRAKDSLFLGFRGDPNEPSVMVAGNKVTIAELMQDKLKYQRYVDAWAKDNGTDFARGLYYRVNAPWKAYFFDIDRPETDLFSQLKDSFIKRTIRRLFYKDDPIGFYTRYGKVPAMKKVLQKWFKKQITPSFWKDFIALKEEGVIDFLQRTIRENYRSIIDYEFKLLNLKKDRQSIVTKLLLESSDGKLTKRGKAIQALASSIETVASGQMTDYDGLAIAIGRNLKDRWPDLIPYLGNSLQDYHREGSKLLEAMREQGLIRVNSRGVTRRAVVDLDTGRAGGFWKDTVSREIEILDPTMIRLQDYSRRLELSNRFGIDRPKNAYYVVPFKKNYVDARGDDTGVSVITRSAKANFDEKQLDGDFADMLNHTMAGQYEVDPEFASFMDDLVRFKDQRGRADYYDGLNLFREEIVRRGDQGYGLMEAVRYYRATGRKFSANARIDGRGRVYYNGYLTPTGGEVVRPFLNSAIPTSMTPEGLFQLRIQMGAVIGPGTEALTNAGRLEIFARHEASILKVGELLSATTQRDRRIREFLELPFIQETEGEEIAKIARFSLEYYRIWHHTGGDFSPEKLATYYTKLMGEADASASGLQVIALSTGNRGAALTSNVLQTTRKMRIYDLVAQDVVADPRFQQLMRDLGLNLTWEDLSKASKYQVNLA